MNEIDPVYHKASTKVYRHSCTYPGRGFVGAVQDMAVACNPVDCGDISLETGSEVDLIDRTVDVELLEVGMTCPKELRGLPSSLNYVSGLTWFER